MRKFFKKILKFVSTNSNYFISFLTTFGIGAAIFVIVYFFRADDKTFSTFEIIQLVMDFFMPTIFVYLLTNYSNNVKTFGKLERRKKTEILLPASIIYILSYICYAYKWKSWGAISYVIILTIIVFIIDILSYLERNRDLPQNECSDSSFVSNEM